MASVIFEITQTDGIVKDQQYKFSKTARADTCEHTHKVDIKTSAHDWKFKPSCISNTNRYVLLCVTRNYKMMRNDDQDF